MTFRLYISLLCMLPVIAVVGEEVATEEQVPVEQVEPPVDPILVKEQAIAAQLAATEVRWLTAGDSEFLSRYKADETGSPQGSLLFVGGPGVTVLSSPLVNYAFDFFPTVAWHTMAVEPSVLSFDGPRSTVPEGDAAPEQPAVDEQASADSEPTMVNEAPLLPDEAVWFAKQHEANQASLLVRLQAAQQNILQEQGGYVLIARAYTASIILPLIQQQKLQPMGLILLDLDHPYTGIRDELSGQLAELNLPILDIYTIRTQARGELRRKLSRKDNYRLQYLSIPTHDSRGNERVVGRFIRNWLVKNYKI